MFKSGWKKGSDWKLWSTAKSDLKSKLAFKRRSGDLGHCLKSQAHFREICQIEPCHSSKFEAILPMHPFERNSADLRLIPRKLLEPQLIASKEGSLLQSEKRTKESGAGELRRFRIPLKLNHWTLVNNLPRWNSLSMAWSDGHAHRVTEGKHQ